MIGDAVAAAAHALGSAAPAVLARLDGPIGDDARAATAELARLPSAAARARRAGWAALARAPVPPGLRAIEPTWIEAALAGLPARARAAVARGGGDPIDVWLARWACAGLCAMTARDRDVARLLAAPPAALAAWLAAIGGPAGDDVERVRAGARRLAPVIAGVALAARQLAQRLPRPLGRIVEAELRAHAGAAATSSWSELGAP